MDIKEILKGYLAIEVVYVDDGKYQLEFRKGYYNNNSRLRCDSILEFLGLTIHPKYIELLATDALNINSESIFVITDCGVYIERKRSRSISVFKSDGLTSTSVYEDLKKFKDDYDTWLESYLDDISPALQKKMDTVLPKGFGKDEVNLLLSKK